jgi:prepilin-type N-terminal cleavage/methylation domain-containing protein
MLRRAFTLIELVVVIAIIALLVSLLAIHLSKSWRTTRDTVCKSQLRQIVTLMQIYLDAQREGPRLIPDFGVVPSKGLAVAIDSPLSLFGCPDDRKARESDYRPSYLYHPPEWADDAASFRVLSSNAQKPGYILFADRDLFHLSRFRRNVARLDGAAVAAWKGPVEEPIGDAQP